MTKRTIINLIIIIIIFGLITVYLLYFSKEEDSNDIIPESPEVAQAVIKRGDLCNNEPTYCDNGRAIYPIDEKYNQLDFLGQLFTAAKCGHERLNQLFGINNNIYDLGSTIYLKEVPNNEFKNIINEIGYICNEDDNNCIKCKLEKNINIYDLLKLEPFSDKIDKDDCIFCG